MSQISEHFDKMAEGYDYYKKKNWYYYTQVKGLYREYIREGSRVLEIGCGTGDVLDSVKPSFGVGIDISQSFVDCAKKKYINNTSLKFMGGNCADFIEQFKTDKFDFIFMSDVIEHLEDVDGMISNISHMSHPNTKVIISMGNPAWEPILLILEKLGLKMPEGPHVRIGGKELESILKLHNFNILETGERTLIPANIPGANWVNKNFYKVPILKKLGLIYFWICQPR